METTHTQPSSVKRRERSRIISTTELARFLGCTERHIYHLRERGLPTIRLGSLTRQNEKEVAAKFAVSIRTIWNWHNRLSANPS